ncbi:hypothetical protein [Bacillus atrophaeus]|uniref:hypothetical protein n=1 Tax=Bacillus atrophaeus TaxID=1452 RepID=UPI003872AEF8
METKQKSQLDELLVLQSQINTLVTKENIRKLNLLTAIETFLEKNFPSGSKADREDYWTHVTCKDIWDLRESYRAYKGV